MNEMTPERAEAQLRIQALMNVMIQSMVNMIGGKVEDEMSDIIDEEELDMIMTMAFVKSAIDLSVNLGIEKEQFLSLCDELYGLVELHMSTPVGNA